MKKRWQKLFFGMLCLGLLLYRVPAYAAAEDEFILPEENENLLAEDEPVNENAGAAEETVIEDTSAEPVTDEAEESIIEELTIEAADDTDFLVDLPDEDVVDESVIMDPEILASGPVVLSSVSIQVTAPRGGEVSSNGRADSHVTVPAHADYTVERASWAAMSGESLYVYADEGEGLTFTEGETYYLVVTLKANDDYDFLPTLQYQPDAAEVTGANYEYIEEVYNNSSTGYSAVILVASVTADEPLYSGTVTEASISVIQPVAGRTTTTKPDVRVPQNKGYSVRSSVWCTSTGDPLDTVQTFEAGETYYLSVVLEADEDCIFLQGSAGVPGVEVTVTGGTAEGDVLITNQMTDDGHIISRANVLLCVTALEAPEGVIMEVSLGFTPPAAGDEVTIESVNHRIVQNPPPAVTIPAGALYSMSSYWDNKALWFEPDGNDYDTCHDPIVFEAYEPYYLAVLLNHEGGYRFDLDYTFISMENAELVMSEIEGGLLYMVFSFEPKDDTPPDELCTIHFDANGGSGEMKDRLKPGGKTFKLPACSFSKTDRVFCAWSVNGVTMKENEEITLTEDITVKALWAHNSNTSIDLSADKSTTTVTGNLLLTDLSTGKVYTQEVSSNPVSCKLTDPTPLEGSLENMVNAVKTDLFTAAATIAGDSPVTVKEEAVSDPDNSNSWNHSRYLFHDAVDPALEEYDGLPNLFDEEGDFLSIRYFIITGDYGRNWVYTYTLEASFESIPGVHLDNCSSGHAWGEWTVTKAPTETAAGVETRICRRNASHKETREIPKLTGTQILTTQQMEAAVLARTDDSDPGNSVFGILQAKVKKVTKNTVTISWKKVSGASSYTVYGNKCGKGNKYKKLASVSGTTFTQKGLVKGTYYKYLVVANGGGKALAVSKTLHAATSGGKVGNSKSVKLTSKKTVRLKKGKKSKIKAKALPKSKKLKVKAHRKLAFESNNPKVAVVDKKGRIRAVGKGTCVIYVYAQNGVFAKVKVKVK